MKKTIYTVIIAFFTTIGFAQTAPTKPSFENVVFLKGDSIIVQKSLPIYVSISTSKGGKSYNLESTQNPSDASPMYLDTEGQNFIRSRWALDPETKEYVYPKREILMPIYADGIAPSTRLSYSDAPKYVSNGTVFYGVGLSYSLSSSDAVSGVQNTYHALNGSFGKYTADNVAVTKEGENSIFYFSADNVGNAEETKVSTFTYDITAPETSLSEPTNKKITLTTAAGELIVMGLKSNIELTSEDKISGVRKTEYNVDGGATQRYYRPLNFGYLSDGTHQLSYSATDNVKNQEVSKTFDFYLDKTAPVTEISVNGDQYQGNYQYVSDRTKFGLSSTDNKAGVESVTYAVRSKAYSEYSEEISLSGDSSLRRINYFAEDRVENVEKENTKTVYLDTDLPATRLEYGTPLFFTRDTIFITSKTPVTLIARDKHSGVKKTEYKINGNENNTYSAPFFIMKEGNTIVNFNSTDNVNNVEASKTSRSFVDNTPPVIYMNFGLDKIGTEDGLPVYPNYVRMFIGATDDHTGTEKILYSINGADQVEYSSPKTIDISEKGTFSESKKYSVKVEAKDKLGNASSKLFEFIVRD
ncbi:hypothetical protein OA501_01355 [Flavobacteriaceae bacterium]|nr:hypothetical protein [Flavobacteriaceae bacterium]